MNELNHRRAALPIPEPADDDRLVSAVREYQNGVDAGRPPDRASFLARHASIATDLADCLDGLCLVHELLSVNEPQTPLPDLNPGLPLGDYQIVREVGRGGMGVVYEAHQLSLSRRVALKILPFASTLDSRRLQRFRTEATAAANLRHPHIVAVYGIGCERGIHYYAMQFIEGQTLADLIGRLRANRRASRQPSGFKDLDGLSALAAATISPRSTRTSEIRAHIRTVAGWGADAAEALEHAHQLGVVHRDVKPANLLLDNDGTIFVTDFGLAHVAGNDAVTRTGDVFGTLAYMSPERARGERIIDPRSDVYSLGVTLYELLTLQTPFPALNRQSLLRQVFEDDPPPAQRVNSAVPTELGVIVHKAMAKDPANRYASSQALADDLRAWLDNRPIKARPPTWGNRLSCWARRHRTTVRAAAVALALGLVGLLVATFVVAGQHAALQSALGERNAALMVLSDRQDETAAALRAQVAAKGELARALERETLTAYCYRLPLVYRAWRDADLARAQRLLADCPSALRGWEWNYLNNRVHAGHVLRPAPGKNAGQTRVKFSPDGRSIVAITTGREASASVQSWDAATGSESGNFLAPADAGRDLELSQDYRRCLVYDRSDRGGNSSRSALSVFDIATGRELRRFDISASATIASFSPDAQQLAVGMTDGTIDLYEVATGELRLHIRGHTEPVADVVYSPDGATFASLAARVSSLIVGPLDRDVRSGDVRIWDAKTGVAHTSATVALQPPFVNLGRWLEYSPDSRHLSVVRGATVGATIVSTVNGKETPLPARAAPRAFSPDGHSVLYLHPDGTAGIADLADSRLLLRIHPREPVGNWHSSPDLNLSRRPAVFSADARRFSLGHEDGRTSVWDIESGREEVTLLAPSQPTRLAMSPDGKRVAGVLLDQSILIWDLATAADRRVLSVAGPKSNYSALAVSPDGRTLAALHTGDSNDPSGSPGKVILWDLVTGRQRQCFEAPAFSSGWATPGPWSMNFSSDGRRLVCAGIVQEFERDGSVHFCRALTIWDVGAGRVLACEREVIPVGSASVLAPNLDVFGARFMPSGEAITYHASRSAPQERMYRFAVTTQSVDRKTEISHLSGSNRLGSMTVSPNGQMCALVQIASPGGIASAIQVFETTTGRMLWEVSGITERGQLALTFSPDGRRLLTVAERASSNKAFGNGQSPAVVWDSASGAMLCQFQPPTLNGPYGQKARPRFIFSADGQRLASFGGVPGFTIWDANTGRELLTLGESDEIVTDAVFNDRGWLITVGKDGVRVWDGTPKTAPN